MMKYIGFLLLVIGFFLIPIGVGVLIFVTGILILVFDFYKTWVNRLVPKDIQEKIGNEIKESYVPYQGAINSLKSTGGQMLKISGIVLVVIMVILVIRFGFGGDEDTWICDKNGSWVKHGNPAYPMPVVTCGQTTQLPKNKEECLDSGGVWEKQGPEPFETCNRKTIDRGNLCRDSSECEGMCQVDLTADEISLGMRGKLNIKKDYGQCSVWVVELGCRGIMKQGKAQVICID